MTDTESDGDLFLTQSRFTDDKGNESDIEKARKRMPETFNHEAIQKKINNAVPVNTKYKNEWAVSSFRKWQNNRLLLSIEDNLTLPMKCLITPILNMDNDVLNEALQCFVFEVRQENGTKYRTNSLHGMICAIQNYLRMMGKSVNIFEDDAFKGAYDALNAAMKELSASGYGPGSRKQSEPISIDEEDMLWEKGILGDSNPGQLLNTMVYLNGLQFALRGGQEHRSLRMYNKPQITGPFTDRSTGRRYMLYREDVSKANSGGIKHKKVEPKIVKAFDNQENKHRCYVRLWEKYSSLCPKTNKNDGFYLTPLKVAKDDCWYMASPVGINTLKTCVKKMCEKAGIPGKKTNHSLRVTAATRLYDANIEEQQICEQTGHRSSAVRGYKRTSSTMQANVSDVLYGKKSKDGKSETVKGGEETVKGGEETVKGGEETVKGGEETVKGGEETVKGGEETVKGGEETVKGDEETVKGGSDKRSFSFTFNFSV